MVRTDELAGGAGHLGPSAGTLIDFELRCGDCPTLARKDMRRASSTLTSAYVRKVRVVIRTYVLV